MLTLIMITKRVVKLTVRWTIFYSKWRIIDNPISNYSNPDYLVLYKIYLDITQTITESLT